MTQFLLVSFALAAAAPVPAAEPATADRQELLQLARQMDEAWTDRDATANAALFAQDATARFEDEPLGEGREAIRQQFAGFFNDRPAGLRHVTMIERIEPLSADHALWDAEVRVERRGADGNWATLTRIRNVTVAVRLPIGWRIKSVRAFPLAR